ncbi:MAG: hypothetical protein QNK37_27990 [Acidobacteriota bacterium]|nr:hypothetical protein [Acidobacteriota bacterium]
MHKILLIGSGDVPAWLENSSQYEITTADGAWAGIRQFNRDPPDVVIIRQGFEDALETVIAFRESRLPEARFVVLLKGTEEEVAGFRREAAVYGVRQVAEYDVPESRLSGMIRVVMGNSVFA